MGLQLILGNSGSGKTTYLIDTLLKQAENAPKKKFLLIVPEQFTLSMQKEVVFRSKKKCIMNIDILSFERLSYRVFEELGITNNAVLEDIGKTLLLRKVAISKGSELSVLKKRIERPNYLDQIKSMLTEFSQYNISSEDLDRFLSEEKESILYYKLKDLSILYKGLEEEIEGSYMTSERMLLLLSKVADRSNIIKDSVIAFDGYTGFTPVQNIFLESIMPLCEKIYSTVIIDSKEDYLNIKGDHELFYLSKKHINNLLTLARKTLTEIEEPIIMPPSSKRRFINHPGLIHLEENIFRNKKITKLEEQDDVKTVAFQTIQSELQFVVRYIKKEVDNGARYRDFCIVTGDINEYADEAKRLFEKAGIPYFIDNKQPITYNLFIEYVKSLIAMVNENFSFASVFRYLKTGFTNISLSEVEKLENYCIATRCKGYSNFEKEFIKRPSSVSKEELAELNNIRERFMKPLISFREEFHVKEASVRRLSEILYEFIVNAKTYERINDLIEDFSDEDYSKINRSATYKQIYPLFINLLDRYVALLDDEIVTPKEYEAILNAGLDSMKVGTIPASRDSVIIGDIERTRISAVKTLFLVGANDGIIPRITKGNFCLTTRERALLKENKIELAPGDRERVFIQRFYLYMILTKPSERLFVTYTKSNKQGEAVLPAFLIDRIGRLFSEESLRFEADKDIQVSRKFDMDSLLNELAIEKSLDADKLSLLNDLLIDAELENSKLKLACLEGVAANAKLDERIARLLYGNELKGSISRLERFAECEMNHYISYGLGLMEREEGEFDKASIGTAIHKSLEIYAALLEKGGFKFDTIQDEDRIRLVNEAVQKALEETAKDELYENERKKYNINRIRRIVERTTGIIKRQVADSGFMPTYSEKRFVVDENKEDYKISLRGTIDRVDTREDEANVTYRVIDYKSSEKKVDLNDVYDGTAIQLLTYLEMAEGIIKERFPEKKINMDGAFYYALQDPMIVEDKKKLSDEEINDAIYKKLQLTGFNKGISTEQIKILIEFVKKKREELSSKIMNGNIGVNPIDESACKYCKYKSICGFDISDENCSYRRQKTGSPEEILAKISEELGGNKENGI